MTASPDEKLNDDPAKPSWLQRHLGRVASAGKIIPELEGLRFIAIVAVFMHHLNGFVVGKTANWSESPRDYMLFHVFHVGNSGVQLFFAISGFVLAVPFFLQATENKPVKLSRYFIRRVTRLEPPFIINLLLISAALVVLKKESIAEIGTHLLATMFYVHTPIYNEWSTINGVSWSLEVEVQFYILAPLICPFFFRPAKITRRMIMLATMAGFACGKFFLADGVSPRLHATVLYHFDFFLVGLLLADVYLSDWNRKPQKNYMWDAVGVACWVGVVTIQWIPGGLHALSFMILFTYWCCFRGVLLSRILSNEFLVTFGGMCYTIYLYHFFIISALGNRTVASTSGLSYPVAILVQTAVLLPVVFFACAIFFKIFERPFMIWKPFNSESHTNKNAA